MCSHTQLHRLLQQLSLLINLQALSQWSPSFEWHFRVQAEITSAQLNWRGPVFHIRGALQQSSVCVYLFACVFDFVFLRACVCVRSHFCIVSVVWCVRGTQAHSGESIWDIYYALHQSFWTLDISLAEQIVSYQNSISEMTCRNSLLYPPPNPSSTLTHSSSPLSSLSLCIYLLTFTYMPSQRIHLNKFTHKHASTCRRICTRTNEVHFSPPQLLPTFPHCLNSLAMAVMYAKS